MAAPAGDGRRHRRSYDALFGRRQRCPHNDGGMLMYLSPSITLVIGLLSGETITPPLRLTFCFAWTAVALYMYGLYQTIKGLRESECH